MVHCHVGSLESGAVQFGYVLMVHCHVGSLEMRKLLH